MVALSAFLSQLNVLNVSILYTVRNGKHTYNVIPYIWSLYTRLQKFILNKGKPVISSPKIKKNKLLFLSLLINFDSKYTMHKINFDDQRHKQKILIILKTVKKKLYM